MDSSDFLKCEVCGGYEICLISTPTGCESGLYTCIDGHTFCKNCFPKFHKKVTSAENIRRIVKKLKWASEYYYDESEGVGDINKDSDEAVIKYSGEILGEYYGEVPVKECPMCNSDNAYIKDKDILEYLLKKHKTTIEKVSKEMKKSGKS